MVKFPLERKNSLCFSWTVLMFLPVFSLYFGVEEGGLQLCPMFDLPGCCPGPCFLGI